MQNVIVAVGSIRSPKLNAVAEALKVCGPELDRSASFQVVGADVPSGVSHTPQSRAETMAGARARSEALARLPRARMERWRYFVGLEGGLDMIHENERRLVFLENWAYVSDGANGAYGQSGGILLPDALAVEVLDRGTELSVAIDAYANGQGIRDAQGAWGVLTRNLITRQDAFRIALINAFAPFFNSTLYAGRESQLEK